MSVMLGISLVITENSIFPLYFHEMVNLNMLIKVFQEVLMSEGNVLPGCYCLSNPVSLCSLTHLCSVFPNTHLVLWS